MFKIYLAGAMTGLSKEERTGWRKEVQQQFENHKNICVINPCDFYDLDTFDPDIMTEREVKEFDLYQVRTSNLILVDVTYPNSIGTAIELQLAYDLHIPIIAYGMPTVPIHPWIEETFTKRCKYKVSAIDYIKNFYLAKGQVA